MRGRASQRRAQALTLQGWAALEQQELAPGRLGMQTERRQYFSHRTRSEQIIMLRHSEHQRCKFAVPYRLNLHRAKVCLVRVDEIRRAGTGHKSSRQSRMLMKCALSTQFANGNNSGMSAVGVKPALRTGAAMIPLCTQRTPGGRGGG